MTNKMTLMGLKVKSESGKSSTTANIGDADADRKQIFKLDPTLNIYVSPG
ncbi:MAG: hypothetical protein KAS23_04485 [Anaerohalosphaera sp.]|nr:hypothetical protein [Anaerohalosphaera sp.]